MVRETYVGLKEAVVVGTLFTVEADAVIHYVRFIVTEASFVCFLQQQPAE